MTTLLWLRSDLRLADNPALRHALERGGAIVPVYIWSPEEEGEAAPGAAARWWLHQSLAALGASLEDLGSRLILRRGPVTATLRALAEETGAKAVVWNRRYEPTVVARDRKVKETLRAAGLEVESSNAALLFEPWTIATAAGAPFQVFTPFWRACLAAEAPSDPLPAPRALPAPSRWPFSEKLESFALEPEIDWAGGLRDTWTPGEEGAQRRLRRFLREGVSDYPEQRNRPDEEGTSRLSPHLHHGEIGPRQIWQAAQQKPSAAVEGYLREIGWREFSHHLLFHFPRTVKESLHLSYDRMAWRHDAAQLKAWQKGRTGFPLVDAGMRELWHTGWMHNRVRMVVGSVLVKDLLIHWRAGWAWFWDTLVDADLGNNTLGWQWVAGSGADAAPFFRIFNPETQAEKFDPDGMYVRRWVPEVGTDRYPKPLVDHAWARKRALAALSSRGE